MKLNLDPSKKYLLAVSGGMDSMVMAHYFLSQGLSFGVAHVNFCLRGDESDLDEKLVSDWCRQHKVTCYSKTADMNHYAISQNLSIQESAREIRYSFFNELTKTHSLDLIATAHHKNDNIETILFHFFRGTGLKGLTGIPPRQENIIRPMLGILQDEVKVYATKHNVPFRQDSSNLKDDYTRNKLRNRIIPDLCETFPALRNSLAENIERMNEAFLLYQQSVERYRRKLIEQRGPDWYIPIRKLKHAEPFNTIVYELLKPFGFNHHQAGQLHSLLSSQTGSLLLSKTHRVIRNRDFLIITTRQAIESEFILIEKDDLLVEGSYFLLEIKYSDKPFHAGSRRPGIETIDASSLVYPLILRKWKAGDYLYPLGMNKKKKVARVLIDAKLSIPEKEQVMVLESDHKIIWISGIKLDNRFRTKEGSRHFAQLTWTIKEGNEL